MSEAHRRQFLANSLCGGAALALAGSLAPSAGAQGFKPKTPAPVATAVVAPPGIKTLSKIPRTSTEVASAHLNGREEATEFLLGGQPLEFNGFALKLTKRDGAPLKKHPRPEACGCNIQYLLVL